MILIVVILINIAFMGLLYKVIKEFYDCLITSIVKLFEADTEIIKSITLLLEKEEYTEDTNTVYSFESYKEQYDRRARGEE